MLLVALGWPRLTRLKGHCEELLQFAPLHPRHPAMGARIRASDLLIAHHHHSKPMTATATRASARDLGQSRKAYANRLEEATGFTIQWHYDQREQAWAFYLIDPYGDAEGDPWYCFADLVHDTQDAVDEYEATFAECEPKLYDDHSDADPGL